MTPDTKPVEKDGATLKPCPFKHFSPDLEVYSFNQDGQGCYEETHGVRCMECGAGTAQKISINEWNDCRPIEDALKQRVKRLENFVRYYGRLTLDEVTDREIAGNLQSKARALAPPVGEKDK